MEHGGRPHRALAAQGRSPVSGPRVIEVINEGNSRPAPRFLCRRGPRHRDRERALQKYGPPVYVRHEIVHNKHVVESLKAKGAHFVEDLSEVPPHAVTIFSAHGVAKSVEEEAAARELPVLNATCPLVTKVHNQGKRYVAQGRRLISSATPAIRRSKERWGKSPAGHFGPDQEPRRFARSAARHPSSLRHANHAQR